MKAELHRRCYTLTVHQKGFQLMIFHKIVIFTFDIYILNGINYIYFIKEIVFIIENLENIMKNKED